MARSRFDNRDGLAIIPRHACSNERGITFLVACRSYRHGACLSLCVEAHMQSRRPTELDDFFFDLRGYLVLEAAVEPELVESLNAAIERFPPLDMGQWYGNAQRRDYTADTGFELHNCREA